MHLTKSRWALLCALRANGVHDRERATERKVQVRETLLVSRQREVADRVLSHGLCTTHVVVGNRETCL